MGEVDFGLDLDSILDGFEEEKKEPIEAVEVPVQSVEIAQPVVIPKQFNTVRPNCPHCEVELSMYSGYPSVHWYCFRCKVFVRDNEIKD